jgi:hypothetical protein
MKTQILDSNALRSISPTALRAYIESEGWQTVERFGQHSQVFALKNGSHELVVPGTTNLADYPNIVAEILERLSQFESRDQLQVFRDLTTADKDVVRVRSPEAEDDGSVALEIGVDLVAAASELLRAAACSAWKPQAVYRAGKVLRADEYMGQVRLGQTEQGSFIVTLLAPVPPTLQHAMFGEMVEEQPFERKVTSMLSGGLDAAAFAIERFNLEQDSSKFDSSISDGVSANLCEAISRLANDGNGVDVSITWAKTRPNRVKRWSRQFTKSEGQILGEVARTFKLRQPRPDERLEGFISDLHRTQTERLGRITLRTSVDGKQTSVKLNLSEDDYAMAIKAHDSKTMVAVEGELVREKQRWQLEKLTSLEIIEEQVT